MVQVRALKRVGVGGPALLLALLALSACGTHVDAGNENYVYVKAGPMSSPSDAEKVAQSHCAKYGKKASIQGGGELGSETLDETYRFDCVEGSP